MAKKVFLGVGHGGSDPGAVANGKKESAIALQIALACEKELERHGVQVKLSRTKEENDPLSEEIRECNAFNPNLAVDIHVNAGGGDGFEVFHTYLGGTGKELAKKIEAEVIKAGQNSRGVKTRKNDRGSDYYGFIRSIKCPSIICEIGFIDTKKDLEQFDEKHEQEKFGKAYAHGILKQLGIKIKGSSTPKPPAKPSKPAEKPSTNKKPVYRVKVDGKQVTALSELENIKAEISKHVKAGKKNILLERV